MFALGVAYWAEHVASMAPCELCLMERWPYRLLVLLGLVWAALGIARPDAGLGVKRPDAGRVLGALVTLTLLVSIGLGVLHVGIEQHWWPNPFPACTAPRFHGGSFAERLASMPAHPAKPCDAPNRLFEWLPISMTTLDVLYAAGLLLAGRILLPRRL